MSILEQAKQSVEYDARVPLEVAQALIDLHKAAQEVVDADLHAVVWPTPEMGHQVAVAIENLAEKLEELQ